MTKEQILKLAAECGISARSGITIHEDWHAASTEELLKFATAIEDLAYERAAAVVQEDYQNTPNERGIAGSPTSYLQNKVSHGMIRAQEVLRQLKGKS